MMSSQREEQRIKRAVARARAYTERMLAEEQRFIETFVVYEDYATRDIRWLTEWEYQHGWGQCIPERDVIWSYSDGYYH